MLDEQALYAIILLLRPSFIRAILNGQTKAKLHSMNIMFGHESLCRRMRDLHYHHHHVLGNCIKSIYMQEVMFDEQALYAIILLLPSFIHAILNGQTKDKFAFNEQHVWMCKFVPKNKRSSLPPTTTFLRSPPPRATSFHVDFF
ncbi:Uncharacterized protein Fot_13903 [Forsythia ovata]|uniref:Maturase K n=1 Tax=Forsythia ovata TaxID=205694 RepID=A0ABD1W8B1_9LAMI